MALKRKTTGSQNVQCIEYFVDVGDTVVTVAGATQGALAAGAVYPIAELPPGARVIGAGVEVVTPVAGFTGGSLKIGDAADDDRIGTTAGAASATLSVAGALRIEGDALLSVTATSGAATAGALVIRLLYITPGKADENSGR
ncbi:MAG: hypothetical protein LBU11_12340 [Zoogloeaceae bacterium]|jgi:hypothetical protein|nr:hypothetical protein [Zoogloeaceae bacterium]